MATLEQQLSDYLHSGPNDDGEWRAFCPAHEDPKTSKTPSASFNFKHGVWICHSCDARGSLSTLARKVKDGNVVSLDEKRAAKKTGPTQPLPTEQQVRLWHKKLMAYKSGVRWMEDKRGLTVATLKKFQVGYDGQRFTIPIRDEDGKLVNVRKYKPNARDHAFKMINIKGHGQARLYGLETIKAHDKLLLVEGELDRMIAEQHGFPVFTHTGGAATFKAEWGKHFKGKIVYVAYDEDTGGDKGAATVAKVLKEVAEAVYRVHLNTGIKGGDVTDFFVKVGRDADDLWKLIEEASPLFVQETEHVVPTKGKRVSVQESQNASYNDPIEMVAMVSGKFDPAFVAPKRIVGTCDQKAGEAKCASCPFNIAGGERVIDVHPDDPRLLKFVNVSDRREQELLIEITEAHCRTHVQFEQTDQWNIEEMSVTPSVAHRNDAIETPIHRMVYNVGKYDTPVNRLARIVGKQVRDPHTGRGTFHAWHLEPVDTDIDTFDMTPALFKRLKRFRPGDGETPLEKCYAIADDLAANATHIYGRPLLHVGFDLVWHSVTSFRFEGKQVPKGWLECLVIGDTRTGKSETAAALAQHYSAGVVKSLEGASFAGLVGGAQQIASKHWMVTWGLLPLNDRRLVVLDEMSGLYSSGNRESKGILEAMSSIRSEGKAQITKITTEETSARTRLIWISNPVSSMPLHESSGGALPALRELVRNPEDIARFDYVMAVTSSDVPSSMINSTKHRRVRHRYTAKLCHELVMWVWSRRADQIKFASGVEEYIYAAAETLGSRYINDPPLIQSANARVKVARIAVALAARTFSSDAKGECIVVRKSHVKDAVKFLDTIYSERAMGYKEASDRVAENRKKAEKAKEEAGKYLRNNPHLIEVLFAVGAQEFRKRDFEELGGIDREEASVILPKMLAWRLISRKSKGYLKMEPALIELLRELEAEGG